ncbi:MAG: hypothetical protein K8W52_32770 [Deltaproteobacteria bacterium]|nr:hypothetical protein [Deltaproteobacteria bacterium]
MVRPLILVAMACAIGACHSASSPATAPKDATACEPITGVGGAGDPEHLGLEVCKTPAGAQTVVTVRAGGDPRPRWTETADALASAYLVGRSHAFIVVVVQGDKDWVVNLEVAADGTVTEQDRFIDSGD